MMSIFSMIDDLQKKKNISACIYLLTNKMAEIRNMTYKGHMGILEGHSEEDFDESFLIRLRP